MCGLSICPFIHILRVKGNEEEMNAGVHKRKWRKRILEKKGSIGEKNGGRDKS